RRLPLPGESMSRPSPPPSQLPDVAAAAEWPVRLSRRFSPGAWAMIFGISLRQFVRGRRLLALAALFALPPVLAGVARSPEPRPRAPAAVAEQAVVFYMIPQVLVPLTALILASGMVRDEVENQTLTYLLTRPLPRPSIYVAKLLAAWLVAAGLATV